MTFLRYDFCKFIMYQGLKLRLYEIRKHIFTISISITIVYPPSNSTCMTCQCALRTCLVAHPHPKQALRMQKLGCLVACAFREPAYARTFKASSARPSRNGRFSRATLRRALRSLLPHQTAHMGRQPTYLPLTSQVRSPHLSSY